MAIGCDMVKQALDQRGRQKVLDYDMREETGRWRSLIIEHAQSLGRHSAPNKRRDIQKMPVIGFLRASPMLSEDPKLPTRITGTFA